MDNGTAILMIKALDGLNARSVITAENIANSATPNYLPLRTSFEAALKEAAAKSDDAVRDFTPRVDRAVAGTPEASLRTDLEMSTASSTALRYDALVEIMSREMQIGSLAVTGNR
ncbi:MAG TPA: hypothetical protein VGM17_18950 [Rhizomicrobium sp.]|jgi:flagellar basal-body rod protein FlgB